MKRGIGSNGHALWREHAVYPLASSIEVLELDGDLHAVRIDNPEIISDFAGSRIGCYDGYV